MNMDALQQRAVYEAERHGIPTELFMRLIDAESSWNPNAVSRVGAIGLTQVMPGTAREMGYNPAELARDPYMQLEAGARYFAQQHKTFGDWETALWAYNAGPGNVRKGYKPQETVDYINKILGPMDTTALASRGSAEPREVVDPRKQRAIQAMTILDRLRDALSPQVPIMPQLTPYRSGHDPFALLMALQATQNALRGIPSDPLADMERFMPKLPYINVPPLTEQPRFWWEGLGR